MLAKLKGLFQRLLSLGREENDILVVELQDELDRVNAELDALRVKEAARLARLKTKKQQGK